MAGFPVLGDSFLRRAYAVFDQDNRNIHLAQAANCGSEIVTIGSGPDAVPSVTGECSPATAAAATSTTSTSATQDATGSAATPSQSSAGVPIRPLADAAAAVGVAIGVAAALL